MQKIRGKKIHQDREVVKIRDPGVSKGSGGWIRTTDLRVMSPTSCHCSTPRRSGARYQVSGFCSPDTRHLIPDTLVGRTDLLSQRSGASTFGAATFHDPVRDGSGWCHRAPRTPLAQGSCRPLCRCLCCLAYSCPPRVSPRKPSPMRTPRLYWSPSLQPAPLTQSSPGGLTPLKGRVSSSWGAIPT